MTDCDNHRIVWIEVLWIKLVIVWLDHSTTCIAILLLHLIEFILHHLLAKFRIVQDLVQVVDGLHQLIELVMQLLQTQACQLAEAHINDSLTLQFVEFETLLQVALSIRRRLAGTDNMNHLINIVEGDEVVDVRLPNGHNELILANPNGRAVRFDETQIRTMGRTSTGVRGMRLDEGDDALIGMIVVNDPEKETVMVVSEQGYGKRSDVVDYRVTNRGGKGVKTLNIT